MVEINVFKKNPSCEVDNKECTHTQVYSGEVKISNVKTLKQFVSSINEETGLATFKEEFNKRENEFSVFYKQHTEKEFTQIETCKVLVCGDTHTIWLK